MADSKLKIDIRRNAIMESLRRDGKVRVADLSEALGATVVTIRNDLAALERDGYLIRTRGGAVYAPHPLLPEQGSGPEIRNDREKRAIAAAVAAMVQDGETLFINSGTTMLLVAAALRARKNLNIVTNCVGVAQELGNSPSIRVLLLGGKFNGQYGFTYGADVEEQLVRYHADRAILSIDGISAGSGISTCMMEEATIDRLMLKHAEQGLIAADYTKVGRAGFSNIQRELEGLTLVTDDQIAPDSRRKLEECAVEIIVC